MDEKLLQYLSDHIEDNWAKHGWDIEEYKVPKLARLAAESVMVDLIILKGHITGQLMPLPKKPT